MTRGLVSTGCHEPRKGHPVWARARGALALGAGGAPLPGARGGGRVPPPGLASVPRVPPSCSDPARRGPAAWDALNPRIPLGGSSTQGPSAPLPLVHPGDPFAPSPPLSTRAAEDGVRDAPGRSPPGVSLPRPRSAQPASPKTCMLHATRGGESIDLKKLQSGLTKVRPKHVSNPVPSRA